MSFERRAIRAAVVGWLTGSTSAGAEVFANRSEAFWARRKNGIAVYTLSEEVETHTDTPRSYLRRLELAVEVFLEDAAAEDAIDDLCTEVECCVEPRLPALQGLPVANPDDPKLGVNLSLTGLTRIELEPSEEGRQLLGSARLVWTIAYGSVRSEEPVARPVAAASVHVDVDLGDETVEAVLQPPTTAQP